MIHDQEEQIEDGNKFMLLSEVRQLERGGGNLNTENSQISPLEHSPNSLFKIQESENNNLQGQYNSPVLSSPVVAQQDNNIKIIENLESTTVKEGGPVVTSPSQLDNLTFREENQFLLQLYQKQQSDENITIQESIVQIVEEFGYPREYVQKCL